MVYQAGESASCNKPSSICTCIGGQVQTDRISSLTVHMVPPSSSSAISRAKHQDFRSSISMSPPELGQTGSVASLGARKRCYRRAAHDRNIPERGWDSVERTRSRILISACSRWSCANLKTSRPALKALSRPLPPLCDTLGKV